VVQVNQGARVDILNKEVTVKMNESGQGGMWEVDANPMIEVDAERTYQVLVIPPKKIAVFLKQEKSEVDENEVWAHVSRRFAASKGLQEWSQFRIFPVNGQVQRLDDEMDNAYTFDWEEGKQYWWWNVYDEAADLVRGEGQAIKMGGYGDCVEALAIERSATLADIAGGWRRSYQIPARLAIAIMSGKPGTFHWCIPDTYQEDMNVALVFRSERFITKIFDGPEEFKRCKLSHKIGKKIPRLEKARIEQQGRLWVMSFDEDPEPLSAQILKTHQFLFHLPNGVVTEPDFSEWWYPYDKEAIMRHGRLVDTEIHEGEGLGRFPPEPWGLEVDVWIKSEDEEASTEPIPVQPQILGWRGAPLGQAPAISQNAAGLDGYISPNTQI
jgi:hypothetical protein